MSQTVGVLALQGDFHKHVQAFQSLGDPALQILEVRTPEHLQTVDRLVIPGGESTTVGLLLSRYGLGEAIQHRAAQGLPVWGTCMGMILMAKEIEQPQKVDGTPQYTLSLLDITVRRNAFGAQVHSFEDTLSMKGLDRDVTGVFIRAPIVTRLGPEVQPLATYQGQTVAVRQNSLLGTSFHPELTEEKELHRWFLEF